MEITLVIPDDQVARIKTAFITRYGYSGEDTNAAKTAFIQNQITDILKSIVLEEEIKVARNSAVATVTTDISDNLNITIKK